MVKKIGDRETGRTEEKWQETKQGEKNEKKKVMTKKMQKVTGGKY